jgi:hypothetical protein
MVFLGVSFKLQFMLDGHDLWATETNVHKKLTMSTKNLLTRENIAGK